MIFIYCKTLPCDPRCEPKKILKNFIEHKVIAVEIYLKLWSFFDLWHKSSGKQDVIGKNYFDIRVQQEKSYQNS